MSLVVGEGVGKNFGAGYIFEELSFCLEEDDRIGLVGPNGQGKTTLIRILAGLEEATQGNVIRRKGLKIGYLPQDAPVLPGVTLWQYMLDVFAELRQMEADLAAMAETLGRPDAPADLLTRYGGIQHAFEDRGGYGYHTRMEQVLSGLALGSETYQHPLAKLSGGQRSRAMLAGLLLGDPDLLLLDEPTNHLDLEAIEWLERYLESFRGAILCVSHDRYFLDRVMGGMWDMSFGKLDTFKGNYSAYHQQKLQRQADLKKRYEAQQEFVERTQDFIRRNVGAKRVNVAQGRKTRLERYLKEEAIDRPPETEQIHLRFKDIARSGDPVFRSEELVCGYDPKRPLLGLPDTDVYRGQRVAVIGGNGVGKTTLLRTLMGEIKELKGRVRRGANLNAGYLAQTHDNLNPETTAVQAVLQADPNMTTEQARKLLGGLLLSGDEALRKIGQLSGGQRSRVVLARLVAKKANVLLLDEPTNHLDIPSQEVLQEMLSDFPGTVIFVSHDRYLVRALAQRIWAIEDGMVINVAGGWEEYLRYRQERAAAQSRQRTQERKESSAAKDAHRQARRQTNQVQRIRRRQEELEQEIQQQEARLTQIGHAITAAGQEGKLQDVHRLGREYQQAETALNKMWDEWTGLTEELESLDQSDQP